MEVLFNMNGIVKKAISLLMSGIVVTSTFSVNASAATSKPPKIGTCSNVNYLSGPTWLIGFAGLIPTGRVGNVTNFTYTSDKSEILGIYPSQWHSGLCVSEGGYSISYDGVQVKRVKYKSIYSIGLLPGGISLNYSYSITNEHEVTCAGQTKVK